MYIVQVAIRDSTKHHTHTHALYTVGLVRACVLTYLPTVRSKPCLPQAPWCNCHRAGAADANSLGLLFSSHQQRYE